MAVTRPVDVGDGPAAERCCVDEVSHSQAEQVKAIGVATGEEIRFKELTPKQAREQWLRDGCPQEFADWRIELLAVSVDGPGSLPPTDTFQRITGRPPRTFAQWALDHAADFRPPARTDTAGPPR